MKLVQQGQKWLNHVSRMKITAS